MPRPRKTKTLHLLEGTYKPSRHDGRKEIELPPGIPDKPDYLSKVAAAEWDFMVEKLSTYGILSDIDGAALAAYCELYSEFQATRSCPAAFPAAKFGAMRAYITDLGLSPAARTKIPGSNQDKKENNPFSPKAKKGRKSG